MDDLAIRSIPGRRTPSTDFGATVAGRGDELEVPEAVGNALADLRITTASAFLSYVQSSPSSIASRIGWSAEQVRFALPKLIDCLRGRIPEEFLMAPKRRSSYGAVIPGDDEK